MRVDFNFKDNVNVSEALKFNTGIKPRYGKGTMKGCVYCSCGRCVACLMLLKNRKIMGYLETRCTRCHNEIDYSEVDKYV